MTYLLNFANPAVDKEFYKFLDKLEKSTKAKILRSLELLKTNGHALGMPHSKMIDHNLFELRTSGIEKIRIFYCFKNNVIYVLSIFKKKTHKTPLQELEKAKKILTII